MATHVTFVATVGSAAALLLLLTGLYLAVTRQLESTVADGLVARSADVERLLLVQGRSVVSTEPYAELYDGALVAASPALADVEPLVPDLGAIPRGGTLVLTRNVQLRSGQDATPLRVVARTLPDGQVLTVAASLEPQREAGERLLVGLAVAGPLLLLLVAVAVHRSVRSALRPVDELTREAAQISSHDATQRLTPVPGEDEVARLASTLDAMLQRLALALDRERSFVDDASHELRTPIAVLRGELELALSDLADRAGVETSLRAALAEAQRLSRLAEDLLGLARERSGTLTLRREDVEVDVLLAMTCTRLGPASGLALEVDCPAGLHLIGDPDRLEQVLGNLLRNSAEAGAGRAVLAAAADDGELVLSVADDGPGFPVEFVAQAFERFSRADSARTRTSGAGLGLALVAAITEAAGGSVGAQAHGPLGGGVVTLRLPGATQT